MGYHYTTYASPPTPTPQPSFEMDLVLEDRILTPGDQFYLHYALNNPENRSYTVDVWVVLEMGGSYWFYPSWRSMSEGVDFNPGVYVSVNDIYQEDVLNFVWPSGLGSGSNLFFYGAAFNVGTTIFAAPLEIVPWQYQ